MPILDIQKRARELGRIRIGQVVPTSSGKTRPEKLDRFRLTSHSRPLLEKVAALYGGTVAEWTPQGGGAKAWEVVTDTQRLPIMVPRQPVTQWYEFWTAGGCKHRCDGRTNVLTDELCDPEDFAHREAIQRPTTRLSVVLRDVEGIGVWRLETHGFNAAVELPDAAEFLAQAGGYVNGWVSLEPRTSKAEVPDGNGGMKIQTRHFHVPILEIDVTPAELMAGKGRVSAPVLEGPAAPVAIAAAGPDYVALAADLTTADEVRALWVQARDAGYMTQGLSEHLQRRAAELTEQVTQVAAGAQGEEDGRRDSRFESGASSPTSDAEGIVDAEVVEDPPTPNTSEPDPDWVWAQCMAITGQRGMSLEETTADFKARYGILAAEATGAELEVYLNDLRNGVAA